MRHRILSGLVLRYVSFNRKGIIMKKNLIAIIAGIFISVPSLFAFHDLATDHLVPGMPVVFIATGPKFPPAMHDAVRTALGRWSSSDCFMSLQNSIDAAVDAEGRGMVIMRWATKEAYVHDQKKMNPKLLSLIHISEPTRPY